MDKLSYAWGLAMGRQLKGMGVSNLDADTFRNGVMNAFDGTEPAIPVEEAQKLINDYLQELQDKAEKVARAEGEQFLAENGKKENVKTTASGLQYVVEKEGTGQAAVRPGVRQQRQPWRARHIPPEPRHPRMDRRRAAHEGRRQVHFLHPQRPGLRPSGCTRSNPAPLHPYI